ncbi:SLIT-ROBO Rho GTPase-activating protein 1 [Cricetulus griseus]|uniref:SLIT-ROBO Rho GTPase-activating protein 1 n=1 Tax=Cricetulus griseus TaxID=10029 RepID=G3H9K3_CRIGR|nr:SLIT-ROBO Rho GTPase-activating protein 1 [Cricetulus griseus]
MTTRPPNVPPKPQKHRKSRPRSQYNAKLFNGDLETFVKVLHQPLVADLHAFHYNGLSLP